MPPKIRELISQLERNGFINRGGKGSHRNFEHPLGEKLTISGKEGDDGDIEMKSIADQYEKIVYWSDEDECYIGVCPEFFSGGVHGDDPTLVFKELLVDEWVEIFEEDGKPLPEPKHSLLQAA